MKAPKYLVYNLNGKRQKVLNGWLILREEIGVSRQYLLRIFEAGIPNGVVLKIAKKAKTGRNPLALALSLLKMLTEIDPRPDEISEEKPGEAPNTRGNYQDPYKT